MSSTAPANQTQQAASKPSVHMPLAVGGLVALCLFAVTGVFAATGYSQDFGIGFTAWLQGLQTGWLTTTMKTITTVGEWYGFVAICLILLLIPRTRWRYGLPLAVVTIVGGALNAVLKIAFREPRPNTNRLIVESGFSFPSGHAMTGASFVCMAVFLVLFYVTSRRARITISTVLILAILLIGASRLYLGVHWPTDIIGGYFAAFSVFVATLWLYQRFSPGVLRVLRLDRFSDA